MRKKVKIPSKKGVGTEKNSKGNNSERSDTHHCGSGGRGSTQRSQHRQRTVDERCVAAQSHVVAAQCTPLPLNVLLRVMASEGSRVYETKCASATHIHRLQEAKNTFA